MIMHGIVPVAMCITLLLAVSAGAEQSMVASVAKGCRTEIETYCKDVTPSQGCMLACLYAHSDKLSGKCKYDALYDAATQLERALAALS